MDKIVNTTVGRIIKFIEYKGISKREFATSVGISHSLIGKANAIGSDKLENILSKYPELNPVWLLTGEGDMLLSRVVTELKKYVKPTDDDFELETKNLVWLVWTVYEKQNGPGFGVNSFESLAKIFDLASVNVRMLQTAMETDVLAEINSHREAGVLEFDEKEESIVIPESVAHLFAKYATAYKALSEPAMALMKILHSPAIQRGIFEYVRKK